MRRILTALMLLGLTATIVAQTPKAPVPQTSTWPSLKMMSFSGPMKVTGTVTEVSGNVTILTNGIQITADEVTMDSSTQEMSLRGNVRVKLLK